MPNQPPSEWAGRQILKDWLNQRNARRLFLLEGPDNSELAGYALSGRVVIVQEGPNGWNLYLEATTSTNASETVAAADAILRGRPSPTHGVLYLPAGQVPLSVVVDGLVKRAHHGLTALTGPRKRIIPARDDLHYLEGELALLRSRLAGLERAATEPEGGAAGT